MCIFLYSFKFYTQVKCLPHRPLILCVCVRACVCVCKGERKSENKHIKLSSLLQKIQKTLSMCYHSAPSKTFNIRFHAVQDTDIGLTTTFKCQQSDTVTFKHISSVRVRGLPYTTHQTIIKTVLPEFQEDLSFSSQMGHSFMILSYQGPHRYWRHRTELAGVSDWYFVGPITV